MAMPEKREREGTSVRETTNNVTNWIRLGIDGDDQLIVGLKTNLVFANLALLPRPGFQLSQQFETLQKGIWFHL